MIGELERIGKRLPYNAPQGYLDTLVETQAWKRDNEIAADHKPHRRIWVGWASAAASIAILLTVAVFARKTIEIREYSDVLSAFENLSEEDQAFLLDAYDEDAFYTL